MDTSYQNMILTGDQLEAWHNLQMHIRGLHFVTGPPGSGKTFFTTYIINEWRKQGKLVLLCATTGAAAIRMSPEATTVH